VGSPEDYIVSCVSEWNIMAGNMIVILKMNPAVYSGVLQEFPSAPRCAICRSDVVYSLTGMNFTVRPPK